MHAQDPPVIHLETHHEDQNTVVFKDNHKKANIKNKNKLTAYFYLKTVINNFLNRTIYKPE